MEQYTLLHKAVTKLTLLKVVCLWLFASRAPICLALFLNSKYFAALVGCFQLGHPSYLPIQKYMTISWGD